MLPVYRGMVEKLFARGFVVWGMSEQLDEGRICICKMFEFAFKLPGSIRGCCFAFLT